MDRYDDLDLDLECEEGGGNVSQKAALFGGMFKKPKSSEASDHQTQDVLSTSRDISKSNDSLTDSNSKDKGTFKGKFKKTTKSDKEGSSQASLALPNPEMSASCESLENNKPQNEKLVGKAKRSPRPGHVRRHSQDLLDFSPSNDGVSEGSHSKGSGGMFSGIFKKSPKPPEVKTQSQEDLSAAVKPSSSNDNLSENGNSKEHGGMFSGMFKKASKPLGARTKSQEDLLASNEKLGSSDNLSVNTNNKESGGMFSGIFKKSPKNYGARAESKEDLSAPGELSGSKENLSGNSNTKESGGMFGGMFKKASKPYGARAQSQEDLSAPSELSGSKENLSGNSNTKESGGMFSGMFKKASKPYGARAQSQEDLSADTELSGSKESLSENRTKEKGGIFSGVFRKKVPRSQSQDYLNADGELSVDTDHFEKSSKEKKKSEHPGDLNEDSASAEKAKVKENGFGAKMKSTFHAVKQEKNATTDDELSDNDENQPPQKQSKLAGAMSKLNPFRTAHKHEKQQSSDEEETVPYKEKPSGHKQKDSEAVETLAEKEVKEKPKPMKRNMIQSENKERSETPPVPRRTTSKENTGMATEDRVKPRRTKYEKNKSDDEGIDAGELPLSEELQKDAENKPTKVTRQIPFIPWAADKAASDDELLKEDNELSSREDKTEEEDTDKPKVRKVKKHNPFMPRVKGKVKKPKAPDGATGDSAENEGANMSVFDQLEEYRIGTAETANDETDQDVVDLMDWWNTVESWEDTPQNDDMTEKEEAKAFAVTAEKVQKGIRVFNKLFSERAECLWQHVIDLNTLADSLDKFNKNTKIAQITGGSTSAIGGVCTITGLALAPVTMGTSLIVTAIGLGIATAGGLTSAGAGISNQVNNSMDRKKVEKIVEDYQEKIGDLNKCLKFIKQGIENLRRFDLIKMKNNAYNQDFPALTSSFYEDGAMAGKAILINANEIMRVVQIANVAGSTAARAVQIASMATGVLTGLFVGMDIYFVAKDSKILKKGAKSEFAAKIREVATQLHDGLVELNTIREELQSTSSDNSSKDNEIEAMDADKKETDDKQYSSDEDEIDRIKKAIKKDYENREYV